MNVLRVLLQAKLWQLLSQNCSSKGREAAASIHECPLLFRWRWRPGLLTLVCTGIPGRVVPSRCWRSPRDRNEEGSLRSRQKLIWRVSGRPYLTVHPEMVKADNEVVRVRVMKPERLEHSTTLIHLRKVLEGVRKMLEKGIWLNYDLVVWLINTNSATKKNQVKVSVCFRL